MQRNEIRKKVLSKDNINRISNTGYWVTDNHGSQVIEYFEDNDLDYEYANSAIRKKVIKEYIVKRIDNILDELELIEGQNIFRTIYAESFPNVHRGYLGKYWSTRRDTNPCVERDSSKALEITISTKADDDFINYYETALSRLDYVFGDREEEVQLNEFQDIEFKIIEIN